MEPVRFLHEEPASTALDSVACSRHQGHAAHSSKRHAVSFSKQVLFLLIIMQVVREQRKAREADLGLKAEGSKVLDGVCAGLHARHDRALMALCNSIHPGDHVQRLHAAGAASCQVSAQLPCGFLHPLVSLACIGLQHLPTVRALLAVLCCM